MNSTKPIKYLINGSISHRLVTELKSDGKYMDFDVLVEKLKVKKGSLESSITTMSPAVTKNGSKVSLNKSYSFVLVKDRRQLSRMINLSRHNSNGKQELPLEARDKEDIDFSLYRYE